MNDFVNGGIIVAVILLIIACMVGLFWHKVIKPVHHPANVQNQINNQYDQAKLKVFEYETLMEECQHTLDMYRDRIKRLEPLVRKNGDHPANTN